VSAGFPDPELALRLPSLPGLALVLPFCAA
jgi:hypothetical protein